MNTIKRLTSRGYLLHLVGIALLFFAVTGESCVEEERDLEIVATVELDTTFTATGSQNTYNAESLVELSEEIDLQEILDDNDLEEITDIAVEAVLYRVARPDPEDDRVVTASIFTVREPGDEESELFDISTATINDPALQEWQVAPLDPDGIEVLNSALDRVRNFQTAALVFHISGTSTPVETPTNFDWEVKVRIRVVGVRKITVIEPI